MPTSKTIQTALWLLTAGILAAADVRTDKDVYYVLDPINVTYSGMSGDSGDWIALAPAGSDSHTYLQYFYTGGATSGAMKFNPPAPGDYEIRAFYKNGYDIQARKAFKVIYPVPQVKTDKPSYLVLEPITVTYSNMAGYGDDWISIFKAGRDNHSYLQYFYTGGAKSGTMKFNPPNDPGNYEIRALFNNGYDAQAKVAITVSFPTPQMSTDRSAYLVLDPVTVTYSNLPGYADDYITVISAASPDNVYSEYYYSGGKKSGAMVFKNSLEPGKYEARLHFRNEDPIVRMRLGFTVAFPVTQVRTEKPSYSVGEPINVTYSDMPGYPDDYITIVPAGSPDATYWEYYKAAGKKSGAMTFTRKLDAGSYEARVHYRNEDAIVRARYAFTVGAAACTFNISPTGTTVAAPGGTGSVTVTAGASDCAWTAARNVSWITINSGTSGTGNGTVQYTADANTVTADRSGTLTIAGKTFTVTQSAAAPVGPVPTITAVLNGGSMMPSNLPAGALAQGSIFCVTGTGLGPGSELDPATGTAAGATPFDTTLAGVSVKVAQGGKIVDAYPVFVWAGRIDAVLPSTAPLGDVSVIVTYKGASSTAAAAKVVISNFGAFSTNGKGSGRGTIMNVTSDSGPPVPNTNDQSAKPGQVVLLMGTGLGPITTADNMPPPAGDLPHQVEVFVGGKPAPKLASGRAAGQPGKDQIQFRLPADTVTGCNVPVQVRTGGTFSNVVTMAIDTNGQPCSTINPWAGTAATGGKIGQIFLLRVMGSLALLPDLPPVDLTLDLGIGSFNESAPGGDQILNALSAIPPLGTCTAAGGALDAGSLLGGGLTLPGGVLTSRELDAGTALTISGPNGSASMPHSNPDDNTGMYTAILGGGIPLFDDAPLPPFLDAGAYTIAGAGGKDVGPFTATVTIPPALTWTNRDAITTIDRNAGVTLKWTGAAESQLVLIAGGSTDSKTKAAAGFLCFVAGSETSFTVPASALANLPATGSGGIQDSIGALMVGGVPAGALHKFSADGLDSGLVFYGSFLLKTVGVQ